MGGAVLSRAGPAAPALTWAVALAATVSLAACTTPLPPRDPAAAAAVVETVDTSGTALAQSIAPQTAAQPGLTGVHPLPVPRDAFAARMLLAAAAQRTLDLQYYIWHDDVTGLLLFDAVRSAAARGVHVRLLLDDANTAGLDPLLAALDAHPNIEVRLYNPLTQRGARALNFLTDFDRVNRRMHNKSFSADRQAAVVGGRNVGDEYYGASPGVVFADLDLLVIGQAAAEVSREFERYWGSAPAYPLGALVPPATAADHQALAQRLAAAHDDPAARRYLDAVRAAPFVRELLQRALVVRWARTELVYDDPAKTLAPQQPGAEALLLTSLLRTMGEPRRGLDLVSPYFVPGEAGTAKLVHLAQSGVQVRVLTNSLAATDVTAVHAGYARRREALLRGGVRLYEFKPSASPAPGDTSAGGLPGSGSGAALHAKTMAVDAERIFVGSFNFDPRSALLNTEMGLVVHDPALGQALARAFDTEIPLAAYEVRLADDGRTLQWVERGPGGVTLHDVEPGAGLLRRAGVGLMSWLPIEWLL